MISQRCPKCKSSRIRRGYKRTPLLLRIFGIYNLLCDHCNLLFKGFAVPGTVPKHAKKKGHQISEHLKDSKKQGVLK
jgi:ribosomal protein L37AE/L43A